MILHGEEKDCVFFCDNDTNTRKLYGADKPGLFKDGINDLVIHGHTHAVNYQQGTKAALNYEKTIPGRGSSSRWCPAAFVPC